MAQVRFNGPDQVLPATDFVTVNANGLVRLRIPESGKAIETTTPFSVPGLLIRASEQYGNHTALMYKKNNKWNPISYIEYLNQVRTCAKAFIQLGLEESHSVCILGFNSPEWFISNLAGIFAGGISVGLYTTNSSETCFYCIENSNANIVIAENEEQIAKILEIRSRLPNLKAIIQYSGEPKNPDILSWDQLLELGRKQDDAKLDNILKSIAINQCCSIVYTSGTTGSPKGVMLSHDNFTWNALAISERVPIIKCNEYLVSYLPLSHVAAQVMDIYVALIVGATVYFADKNALKGSLINTLKDVQPTKFLGVPRVWEKIYETMQQVAASNGSFKKSIAAWAKGQALQHNLDAINGIKSNTWGYTLASMLVFKKIKQALGLNRCNLAVSAAAPISSEIKRYFLSLDIPIMDVFGMSEASGPHTLCIEEAYNLETVGMTIPGMKSKLHNIEGDQGELCLYGRHIFMGYLNEPEKTSEALDEDGWLHTGDFGRIDEKGFVYITGRIKELIITAGGENIPPILIEQMVKAELPHISNAFLIGDNKKFLSILLTFKTEVDAETSVPLDTLLPSVQNWLSSLGCPATTVTELLSAGPNSKLLDALNEGIKHINDKATSNAQRIQKLSVLPADFSIPTGELGPTLKVKRKVVEEKYADIINKMYE